MGAPDACTKFVKVFASVCCDTALLLETEGEGVLETEGAWVLAGAAAANTSISKTTHTQMQDY